MAKLIAAARCGGDYQPMHAAKVRTALPVSHINKRIFVYGLASNVVMLCSFLFKPCECT
jgi:hypothetical protein